MLVYSLAHFLLGLFITLFVYPGYKSYQLHIYVIYTINYLLPDYDFTHGVFWHTEIFQFDIVKFMHAPHTDLCTVCYLKNAFPPQGCKDSLL